MKDLARQEGGATAIEYALVASVVSILIVTAVTTIGSEVANLFLKVLVGLR